MLKMQIQVPKFILNYLRSYKKKDIKKKSIQVVAYILKMENLKKEEQMFLKLKLIK